MFVTTERLVTIVARVTAAIEDGDLPSDMLRWERCSISPRRSRARRAPVEHRPHPRPMATPSWTAASW
jgi:hypothetical protein